MDTEEIVREVADKVREVVDSARKRAEEIVREAEAEAERIRAEAESDARRQLDQVRHSLTELEAALGSTREGPAAGGTSPSRAPAAASEPRSEIDPQPHRVPEPQPPSEPEPQPQAAAAEEPSTEELLGRLAAGGGPAGKAAAESGAVREHLAGVSDRAGSGSEAAARLVAMKLALDGTPRDETRMRLAADYDVADLDSLLDEVYARAAR